MLKVSLLLSLICFIGCQIHYESAPIPNTVKELKEYIATKEASIKYLEQVIEDRKKELELARQHDADNLGSNEFKSVRSRLEFDRFKLENTKERLAKAKHRLENLVDEDSK